MIINGMTDHWQILIGMKPDIALSDLVREIKSKSSKLINEKGLTIGKFAWQNGFGACTVGQSQKENVINYIKTQEEHHRHKTFREEYIGFLQAYQIAYNDQYVFE